MALVYTAIVANGCEKPLLPKELVFVDVVLPVLSTFATGIHRDKIGPSRP